MSFAGSLAEPRADTAAQPLAPLLGARIVAEFIQLPHSPRRKSPRALPVRARSSRCFTFRRRPRFGRSIVDDAGPMPVQTQRDERGTLIGRAADRAAGLRDLDLGRPCSGLRPRWCAPRRLAEAEDPHLLATFSCDRRGITTCPAPRRWPSPCCEGCPIPSTSARVVDPERLEHRPHRSAGDDARPGGAARNKT